LRKKTSKIQLNFKSSREFSLNGDYRNILTKPQDLKYEIIDYSDKTKELTKSDWDLIKPNVEHHENCEFKPGMYNIYLFSNFLSKKFDNLFNNFQDDSIKYKAVVIEYSLQSSSYATMALRELLKDN
jgi:tRNA(Glu) U13 pseudouridine synthase TruD